MNRHNVCAAHPLRELIFAALLILPSVALGVLAMLHGGVSPMLWGQQAAAWALLALAVWPLRRVIGRTSPAVGCVLLGAVLALSLLGEEVGGARRWLDLGIFQMNAAMLVLPALLVFATRLKYPHAVLLGTAVVLSFQPDLSQLTAFAAAAMLVVWKREKKPLWRGVCAALLIMLIVRCAYAPVGLEPVAHCEGILTMLGDVSAVALAAGLAALAAIPAIGVYGFVRSGKLHFLCLAVYYAASMLFGLFGEYPVPFMGFGLSPIAGYWLAYVCSGAQEA